MSKQVPYSRRNLDLRAAEYYASIRKPEREWETIADLRPQLEEFSHRVYAKDYENAFTLSMLIDADYLYAWGYADRLVELRMALLSHLPAALSVTNLGRLGEAYRALEQFDQAIAVYQQAIQIAQEIQDHRGAGLWWGSLGSAYRDQGRFEEAVAKYKVAMGIFQSLEEPSLEDRANMGVQWGRLGLAYDYLEQIELSLTSYEEALRIAREVSDRKREGIWLGNIGNAYRDLGKIDQAVAYYEQALKVISLSKYDWVRAVRLGNLGSAYCSLGRYEQAIECHQAALEIARKLEHRRGQAARLASLGHAYFAQGQVAHARQAYQEALKIARAIGFRRGEGHYLVGLCRVLLMSEDIDLAYQSCEQALALQIRGLGSQTLLVWGMILLRYHDVNSEETFVKAANLCQLALNKTSGLYRERYALATALVGQPVCNPHWIDPAQRSVLLIPALAEYRRALDITAAPGIVRDVLRDLELIRAAGIEGLEPVFALLEEALNRDTPLAEDAPALITV